MVWKIAAVPAYINTNYDMVIPSVEKLFFLFVVRKFYIGFPKGIASFMEYMKMT